MKREKERENIGEWSRNGVKELERKRRSTRDLWRVPETRKREGRRGSEGEKKDKSQEYCRGSCFFYNTTHKQFPGVSHPK